MQTGIRGVCYRSYLIVIALIVFSALASASIESSQLYHTPMQESNDEVVCHQEESLSPEKQAISSPALPRPSRTIAPFSLRHDLARGALHSLSSLLVYALMLSVM